ncbi:MAG: hypothetical protein V1838_02490 [Patescibacteria group bacterium]
MNKKVKRTIIIALSGADGSGKTTQSRRLVDLLRQRYGKDEVAYNHGNRPMFAPDKKGVAKNHWQGRRFGFFISLAILMKNVIKIRLYYWPQRRARFIIFDRYVDDAIAKFRGYYRAVPWLESIARSFLPTAALIIWLDVPPAESQKRDQEFTLADQQKKWETFRDVFDSTVSADRLRIDGSGSAESVGQQLESTMRNRGWL